MNGRRSVVTGTRMAFHSTCRMVVPWKNGDAPTVTPCTRAMIVIPPLGVRVLNCHTHSSQVSPREKRGEHTDTREAWRRDGVRPKGSSSRDGRMAPH